MAVLKLKPYLQHYLWGGRKLVENYNIQSDEKVAEAWVVSCHPDGPSVIESGPNKGMTLSEYIASKGKSILGTHGSSYEAFPILVKLLDANQDLSIQVHPDDEYGLRVENEYGKNEMWLILESDADAIIYYGVNEPLTKDEFRQAIEENTILDKLNKVTTKPYDFFYIPAGTIHALGQGNVIAEVQQSSNSTYRIYDFERRDAQGNLRELHIDKAVEVSNLNPINQEPAVIDQPITELIDNQYFDTKLVRVRGSRKFEAGNQSFQAMVVTKGKGVLVESNQRYDLQQGDGLFVEANTSYEVEGNIEVLIAEV